MTYKLPDPALRLNRTVGGTLHFIVDNETELPSANVIDGDTAITSDNSRYWMRVAGAWTIDSAGASIVGAWTRGVRSIPGKIVSATGISGAANTAQTLATIPLPKNTLYALGDRLNIRCTWRFSGGGPITGTIGVNGVTVGSMSAIGGSANRVLDTFIQYVSPTTANIVPTGNGLLNESLMAVNLPGFTWTAPQSITFSQSATVSNFLTLYFLAADIYPA